MSKTENNLEKLAELLTSDLAKRLLKAYLDNHSNSSLCAILEQELLEKELNRVEDDKA